MGREQPFLSEMPKSARYSISQTNTEQTQAIAKNIGFVTTQSVSSLVNLIYSVGLEVLRTGSFDMNLFMTGEPIENCLRSERTSDSRQPIASKSLITKPHAEEKQDKVADGSSTQVTQKESVQELQQQSVRRRKVSSTYNENFWNELG